MRSPHRFGDRTSHPMNDFKILQANLRKSRYAHPNLMNDDNLRDFPFMMITEPNFMKNDHGDTIISPTSHALW